MSFAHPADMFVSVIVPRANCATIECPQNEPDAPHNSHANAFIVNKFSEMLHEQVHWLVTVISHWFCYCYVVFNIKQRQLQLTEATCKNRCQIQLDVYRTTTLHPHHRFFKRSVDANIDEMLQYRLIVLLQMWQHQLNGQTLDMLYERQRCWMRPKSWGQDQS